jgi:uncharacterized RDD family membrane protein YckC/DNA-directed RNA polymerase subunit RPC12/RpoP
VSLSCPCFSSQSFTTMSTASNSLKKPVYLEYRCARCWNSNCAEETKTGQPVPCNVCGALNVVPEATIDRIERAEAMISEKLVELGSSMDQGKKNSKKCAEDFYRVPSDDELEAEARAASWVPLHMRDFGGYPDATILARSFAHFADCVLAAVATTVGLMACMWMAKQGWVENPVEQLENKDYIDWSLLLLISTPFWILQVFQWVLLSIKGQSVGKFLLGIRIVSVSGEVSGFLQAVFVRCWICSVLSFVIPFYHVINFTLLFMHSRRLLHDYISGTRVVSS